MRLLEIHAEDRFSLVNDADRDFPPYAILSHTWGRNDEEVTFGDLVGDAGKNKLGFRKLLFCAKQAWNDGLRFFWVDTCCIDKTSSSELSEAINSMFRWYQKAAKCYAYLSDVSVGDHRRAGLPSEQSWQRSFRNSRWFTRGWTLQELLAPVSVEFFSAEGRRLGSKNSLVRELHDITGIPVQALRGHPLNQFGIEERMQWARGRNTGREEDMAYSLLGIFNVCIPLIYAEGRKSALSRLRKAIHDAAENVDHTYLSASQIDILERRRATQSVESAWEKMLKSRKESGKCFNCGRNYHWEDSCPKPCGRCIVPIMI